MQILWCCKIIHLPKVNYLKICAQATQTRIQASTYENHVTREMNKTRILLFHFIELIMRTYKT